MALSTRSYSVVFRLRPERASPVNRIPLVVKNAVAFGKVPRRTFEVFKEGHPPSMIVHPEDRRTYDGCWSVVGRRKSFLGGGGGKLLGWVCVSCFCCPVTLV